MLDDFITQIQCDEFNYDYCDFVTELSNFEAEFRKEGK